MARRKGRGLDFTHRFNTSRWAEDLLFEALNAPETGLLCVRLGLSQASEDNKPAEDDVDVKEPDLLVFRRASLTLSELRALQTDLTQLRSAEIAESPELRGILAKALLAIEVEFSPYRASEMAKRDWKPVPMSKLLKGRPRKHADPPCAPNIWIKVEDLPRLQRWMRRFRTPIAVVHIFDQEAFAIDLKSILKFERRFPDSPQDRVNVQLSTGIFRKDQSYDRVDAQGAGERKLVYVVSPAAAVPVGSVEGVTVESQIGTSASKKYVAHVVFRGGRIKLHAAFLELINSHSVVVRANRKAEPLAMA